MYNSVNHSEENFFVDYSFWGRYVSIYLWRVLLCGGQRSTWVSSIVLYSIFFKTKFLPSLTRLAGHIQGFSCFHTSPPVLGLQRCEVYYHIQIFTEESERRSLCLCGKYFSNWKTPQVSNIAFDFVQKSLGAGCDLWDSVHVRIVMHCLWAYVLWWVLVGAKMPSNPVMKSVLPSLLWSSTDWGVCRCN